MHKRNKIKALVAIAVAMVFVMPVAAFANTETIGITNGENTVDIENIVETSTDSDSGNIIEPTGTTWYVDDDNIAGPWDGSLEYPFKEIRDGVEEARPGDTVFVFDGIYVERVRMRYYDTITLTGNSREDVILDVEGYSYGIRFYDSAPNSVVDKLTIRNAGKPVRFSSSVDCTIMNCDIYESTSGSGITVENAPGTSIINCNIYDNPQSGIYAYGGAPSGISFSAINCNIYNNNDGIYTWFTPGSTIENCNIYNNNENGLFLSMSANCNLRGNTFNDNGCSLAIEWGGDVNDFVHNVDPANTIDGKHVYYLVGDSDLTLDETKNIGFLGLVHCTNIVVKNSDTFGVLLINTTDSTILNVTSHNSLAGILLAESSNNDIIECTTYDNTYGIDILSSSNNNVINCTSYNNLKHGIYLRGPSKKNNIIDSVFYDNGDYGIKGITYDLTNPMNNNYVNCVSYNNNGGIYFYGFFNNLTGCSFYNNLEYGIYVWYAQRGGIISDCNSYNNQYGIYVSSTAWSNNNTIHHNNFINNVENAFDGCSNAWNDSYPSGGNYWSDYIGVDNFSGPGQNIPGSDDIGDAPYNISGDGNKDYYPLMNPVGNIDPPEIKDVVLTTSDPLDTEPGFGWEKVTCTITDDIVVDGAKLVVTNPDTTTVEYDMTGTGTDTYECTITLTQPGNYSYHVWTADIGGKTATTDPDELFSLPTNWDVDMNGQAYFEDLVLIVWIYGETGPNGWVREDVDNTGQAYFEDLVEIVWHYGEWWWT